MCGVALPAGLVESSRLPEPIFTPTTKAAEGHDLPLTLDETRRPGRRAGSPSACARSSIALYERDRRRSLPSAAILLADTKFEFGFDRTAS